MCLLACELYVCLQSKTAEGKTAAATATPTSTATERSATPTDKKEKSRSERKRVRVMSVCTVQKRCMSYGPIMLDYQLCPFDFQDMFRIAIKLS